MHGYNGPEDHYLTQLVVSNGSGRNMTDVTLLAEALHGSVRPARCIELAVASLSGTITIQLAGA